jgi:hypothetical protein
MGDKGFRNRLNNVAFDATWLRVVICRVCGPRKRGGVRGKLADRWRTVSGAKAESGAERPAQPLGSTYRWTALAKPSSPLLAVARRAARGSRSKKSRSWVEDNGVPSPSRGTDGMGSSDDSDDSRNPVDSAPAASMAPATPTVG